MPLPGLLVIDDDADLAELLCTHARYAGFEPRVCSDAAQLRASDWADADVIVVDMVMPGCDGIQMIRKLARDGCAAGIIVVSSLGVQILGAAEKLVVERGLSLLGSLTKPFSADAFAELLREAHSRRQTPLPPPATEHAGATSLHQEQLVVVFQPKVDLATLDFCAVEALVRWRHPRLGLVGPDFFIPAAERSGGIADITWAVFHQSLSQCSAWMRDGLLVSMAINVSTQALCDPALPDRLCAIAAEHGVRPAQLTLEVSESSLDADGLMILENLTRLRLRGFGLSLDDFGNGYTSADDLARYPFSELKVDRSFVRRAPIDAQAHHVLRGSIELGHRLGLRVVAEGVETRDQWDLVQALGCDDCQGFFIARPLTGNDTPAWLERWNRLTETRPPLAAVGMLAGA